MHAVAARDFQGGGGGKRRPGSRRKKGVSGVRNGGKGGD